jgi:enterochelin esterase-like enzyme
MARLAVTLVEGVRQNPLAPSTARLRRFSLPLLAVLVLPARLPAQGRIQVDTLHSQALIGNRIGDTPDREVYLYLPPSYDHSPARRYPVLYLLHGITSHPREWLDGSYQGFDLRQAMDSLVATGMTEYLVVMPHADNAAGGTFYVNSAAFGRWEDFITGELVQFVDGRYRTRRERGARGLAGQSMGGFGALYLAGIHPSEFGSVYAMSPCCLGFVGDLAPTPGPAGHWPASSRTGLIKAMASAFAPAERLEGSQGPMPYVGDSTGMWQVDSATVRVWRRFLPLDRLERDPKPFRSLRAIGLDAGRRDQIANVPRGAEAFAAALERAGIKHRFEEYDGGHVDRARERFQGSLLPFFGQVFSRR